MPKNIAVIDIGSNSSRLNVYALDSEGAFEDLAFERIPTGLASCVEAGNRVNERGIELATSSVSALAAHARQSADIESIYVFATASLRGRSNAQEVIRAVEGACGLDVEIISGEEEAACGFASLAGRFKAPCAVMADVGGGSTELVVACDGKPVLIRSLPLGSRALTARFVRDAWPAPEEIEAMRGCIASELAFCSGLELPQAPVLFGIGGTARALQGIATGNKVLFSAGLREQVERSCPERLDTMAAGALIFQGLFEVFKPSCFIASDANPREGYLIRHVIGRAD